MKTKKRKNIYFFLFFISILFFIFATNISAQKDSAIPLIIGGSYDYPPYSFLDETGGPAGFSVEISRALTKIINKDVLFKLESWGDVRNALENNKIHLIHDIVYSEERAKNYEFSNPYYISYYSIFEKKGAEPIQSISDLTNKKIVLIRGDIGHDYVIENNINASIHLVDDYADAILLMEKGHFDFTMMDKLTGLYWIKNLGADSILLSNVSLFSLKYSYAAQKGELETIMEINGALNILNERGEYKEIVEVWMNKIDPWRIMSSQIRKYLLIIIIPILSIFLLLILWSWTLKIQVKNKTKELKENIVELEKTKLALQSTNKELEKSNIKIEITNEELIDSNEKLSEALKEKATLLSEIHHRVKNNLLLIKSMLSIQQRYLMDKDAIKVIEECKTRIHSISLIHESLYRSDNLSKIEMNTYIHNLIINIQSAFSKKACPVEFKTDIYNIVLTIEKAIPVGLIINELLTNAYKHAFNNMEHGIIQIIFKKLNNIYVLSVKDNGPGLPENIVISEESKSYGLKIISILVNQLQGKIDIIKNEGFEIVLSFNNY